MANRLAHEQSPYLLQHAHNPVDWYPWGDEAFEVAAREHKAVLVSIGYAACHWCHVMERESFENEETAAYMNEHFVCIKVDREEHPDVDHLYMDAVQAIGGSGGWPLNVFVTPERAPFYGGTYYPPRPAHNRPSWLQLLQHMEKVWRLQQDEVATQADQMLQHLRQASLRVTPAADTTINEELCKQIAENLLKMADKEKGGFGNAPKFPGTMAISYLLEYHRFTGDEPALQHALHSLDAMIAGGIYDQLRGGFARYSTDRDWLAPHFEKMLYDNALLVLSLCDAYAITRREQYRTTIIETIAFVELELRNEAGGYYCALDADSEGEEGKYYTWTWEEWLIHAHDTTGFAAKHFGVLPTGNWEWTNILHLSRSISDIATEENVPESHVAAAIEQVKAHLLAAQKERVRPLTDDKSLLSWNALMNIALSRAGVVLDEPAYLHRAAEHVEWMLSAFGQEGQLLHTWKKGVARIPAKLDDLAYLIQALLQAAAATGKNDLIIKAGELTSHVINEFGREDGFFYYTPTGQKDIPVRKVDLYDGAIPSANAVMAHNLWLCGMCMEHFGWMEQAEIMLRNMAATASRYAYSFAYWGQLLQRRHQGIKTVVCSGREAGQAARKLTQGFVPHCFLLTCEKEISEVPVLTGKKIDGDLYIFVCSERACLAPVVSVEEVLDLI